MDEDISLSILESIKSQKPDQVFLKLQRMSTEQKERLYINLDNVEFHLFHEMNSLLEKFFKILPENLIDRWSIVYILAHCTDEYSNNTDLILSAISAIIGKKFKQIDNINWNNYQIEAQKLLNVKNNFYELLAFQDFEDTWFYLKHFFKTLNSKEKITDLLRKILTVLREIMPTPLDLEQLENIDFNKYLQQEITAYPIINNTSLSKIKSVIESWNLIPEIEIKKLLTSRNHDQLTSVIVLAVRALRILKIGYSINIKLDEDNLSQLLREYLTQNIFILDYTSHL